MNPNPKDYSAAASRAAVKSGNDALDWAVSSGAAEKVVANLQARNRRRRRQRIGAVAIGAAAVLAIFTFTRQRRATAPNLETAAESIVVAAPVRQILPDGSVVELNAGARIRLEFTPDLRRVVLENSEAHFQVRKDPTRPFVVAAIGGMEVRAVGTAFSVKIGSSSIDVIVTEGRVALNHSDPAALAAANGGATPPPLALVSAGQSARVAFVTRTAAKTPPVVTISKSVSTAPLAWRVPRLELSGTPLSEVIAMFNQYGGARLHLDSELGSLQLSGTLRADDTESLLLLLKNEFDIVAEKHPSGETALRRR